MLFFHVSNCCSHHRNVIWSPRGGEVVYETICLLEVIYKVKKKLGMCPLVTSLWSVQRKTSRASASFFCSLEGSHWWTEERGAVTTANTWAGDCGSPLSTQLQAGRSVPFCCWELPTASLESSPWYSAAPGFHMLEDRPLCCSALQSEQGHWPLRREDVLVKRAFPNRIWGTTPCRRSRQGQGPCLGSPPLAKSCWGFIIICPQPMVVSLDPASNFHPNFSWHLISTTAKSEYKVWKQ